MSLISAEEIEAILAAAERAEHEWATALADKTGILNNRQRAKDAAEQEIDRSFEPLLSQVDSIIGELAAKRHQARAAVMKLAHAIKHEADPLAQQPPDDWAEIDYIRNTAIETADAATQPPTIRERG